MLPCTAPAPTRATQPWQAQRKLRLATDTTPCSSCLVNPKIPRQTVAKGLVSQLDARIGPKAAAATSTVPTVGDCCGQAKLQKEHALGHSCKAFCLCGLWLWCGLCLCERGRLARVARGQIQEPRAGRPRPHNPTSLSPERRCLYDQSCAPFVTWFCHDCLLQSEQYCWAAAFGPIRASN